MTEISKEEIRKAIDRLQDEHPCYFSYDATRFESLDNINALDHAIDMIQKRMNKNTEINIICEFAKLYLEGVKPTVERPHGEWIPIKLRPMTEEEVKEQEEKWGWTLDDKDKFVFDCPLPDEGQEILISTRWGVSIDTCDYDPDYGYGLEGNGDWDGITAWMPLPEPYKEGGDS